MYPSGSFSFSFVNFVKPLQESDKHRFASTFQKSSIRFFLQRVQICVSGSDHVNVFQWDRERFFLRHAELTSMFIVMTTDEVTLSRPEVFPGFSVTFLILSVEAVPVRLEVLH